MDLSRVLRAFGGNRRLRLLDLGLAGVAICVKLRIHNSWDSLRGLYGHNE